MTAVASARRPSLVRRVASAMLSCSVLLICASPLLCALARFDAARQRRLDCWACPESTQNLQRGDGLQGQLRRDVISDARQAQYLDLQCLARLAYRLQIASG